MISSKDSFMTDVTAATYYMTRNAPSTIITGLIFIGSYSFTY